MERNRWIEWSRHFYSSLLHLYPGAYRAVYEMEMFRVFSDQCRDAYKESGGRGILSLWPRTLVDVGTTAIREHLTDPQARLGLLEAMPNAPLPWKGVFLVLVPGLVFFVSQVVELTSTRDWFFMVFYRGAYFLILPVLIAWLLSRRFPVWGLIPFGLLYATLWNFGGRIQILNSPFVDRLLDDKARMFLIRTFSVIDIRYLLFGSICALLIGILIWYNSRRGAISPSAWRWLGVYVLLSIFQVAGVTYRFLTWQGRDWLATLSTQDLGQYLAQIPSSYLYDSLSFLLLVLIGVFFTRRFGGLSFLVLLGFLLPTIIYGRYGDWNKATPFYLVSVAVLVYRFIVAFVAPVWLVREASTPGRQRAAAIPVAAAILSQVAFTIFAYLAIASQNVYQPSLLDFALAIWDQLIIAAGLGLAVALYLPGMSKEAANLPPLLAELE